MDWFTLLQDPVRRDFLSKEAFEQSMSNLGISNDTTVVFYGDKNNWFAAYSLWLFEYFGHKKSKIMNGGRAKWERESRPLNKECRRMRRPPITPRDRMQTSARSATR